MELDLHLVEVVAMPLGRWRQRARALHRAHDREIVGLVARAALEADVAHLAVGRDLEAHPRHDAGPVIRLDPVPLDDAGDALAVDQELGAHDGSATTGLIGALADGTLLPLGAVEAATGVGHPAAPALGRGGELLVHLLLRRATAADSRVSGRGSGWRGSGCRAGRRARRLHVVRLHRER